MQKNRGMFLEYLINQTIDFYLKNEVCWIEKKKTPVNWNYQFGDNQKMKLEKSTTDYYGLYQGRYISIEAKSFSGTKFPKSNLKKHQLEHLKMIADFGGLAYLILYHEESEAIFWIDINEYLVLSTKELNVENFNKKFPILKIEFPGIIDFISLIKN